MNLTSPNTARTLLLALLFGLLCLGSLTAQAQESVTIGQDKVGEISSVNPSPFYSFTAQANQQVTIRLSAVASPVVPQFTIFNSAGVLVQAIGNPALGNSVEGIVIFPTDGVYTIQVSSVDGSIGQFVLSVLSSEPAIPPTPLAENQLVEATLAPAGQLVYSFTGNPNQLLLLELAAVDSLQNVSAELTAASGEVVATLSAKILQGTLLLPPGSDAYLLTLRHDSLSVPEISYRLSLTPQALDEEAALLELPSTGACVLATLQNNEVNIRANPQSDAAILATILPTEIYPVIGRNSDSSWYQIRYSAGSGWVSAAVTRRGGDCRSVAVTATQTAPSQATTTGPTATASPTSSGNATQTPTQAPITTEEAAPQAQVAGDNDQSIEVNIKSESRTVTGAISFPQGNTEDVVSYRVVNFDSITTSGNVVITAVCTGAGAENALVNFAGGSGGVPCNGASATQFHTNDSNQGRVRVSISSGNGAYVNWTLVFSAQN